MFASPGHLGWRRILKQDKMLSPLQIEVARVIGEQLQGTDFALAGGAALISEGVVNRFTNDLDFFGTSSDSVPLLTEKVTTALTQHGFDVIINNEKTFNQFTRMTVRRENASTEVDLGVDYRLFPTVQGKYSPVLSIAELAVNKVLAVFGRAAPRDFVDLYFSIRIYALKDLLDMAKQKDLGFDLLMFSQSLDRMKFLQRDQFEVDDETYEFMVEATLNWKIQLEQWIDEK